MPKPAPSAKNTANWGMAVGAGMVMLADRGTHTVNATSVACAGWNRLPDVEAAMLVEVQKVNKGTSKN